MNVAEKIAAIKAGIKAGGVPGAVRPLRACDYLGERTGETRACPTCAGTVQLKLFECKKHGVCTPDKPVAGAACCRSCPDHTAKREPRSVLPPFPHKFNWVSTAQLVQDAIALAGALPHDCSGIVGVPRSGMIPAATIATCLHLPLWELTKTNGPLRQLGTGGRGGSLVKASGPLAVIEDTLYAGGSIKRARVALTGKNALFCAVYAHPKNHRFLDIYARPLPSPHILEWNLPSNGPFAGMAANPVYGRGIACDFDGVICHDEHSGGPVGGPYLVPRMHPARLIVTGRPLRVRKETEAWLRKHSVKWDVLEMLPDDVVLTPKSAAHHKAKHFLASGCGFFCESCPDQARMIHHLTKKPVICPRAEMVFQS